MPLSAKFSNTCPGPPRLPIIGNLLPLWRNPLEFLSQSSRLYGDLNWLRLAHRDAYLINNYTYSSEVLKNGWRKYVRQDFYKDARKVLGDGLVTSEGAEWLRQKKLVGTFFGAANTARVREITKHYVEEAVERWTDNGQNGRTIELSSEVYQLMLRITAKFLFNCDVNEHLSEMHRCMVVIQKYYERVFTTPVEILRTLPTPLYQSFRKASTRLKFIINEISQRNDDQKNLLSLINGGEKGLGRVKSQEAADHAVTFLIAGYETVASVLIWCLYLISTEPETRAKLENEADGFFSEPLADAEQSPLILTAVKETLRLFPPVWMIPRTATEDNSIGECDIKSNSIILVCPYNIHRNSRYWKAPNDFEPARFVGSQDAAEKHYLPFGLGPHKCIGEAVAMTELMTAVSIIVRRCRLTIIDTGKVAPMAQITLHPPPGIRALIRRR